MTFVKTEVYDGYDDCDIASMLNYCCRLRGNPLCLVKKTVYEFNWFVEIISDFNYDYEYRRANAMCDVMHQFTKEKAQALIEKKLIAERYAVVFDKADESELLIYFGRAFVDYCEKEYMNTESKK